MQIKNIINLLENFSGEHIKKYTNLIFKYHPDRSSDKRGEDVVKLANVIRDELKPPMSNVMLDKLIKIVNGPGAIPKSISELRYQGTNANPNATSSQSSTSRNTDTYNSEDEFKKDRDNWRFYADELARSESTLNRMKAKMERLKKEIKETEDAIRNEEPRRASAKKNADYAYSEFKNKHGKREGKEKKERDEERERREEQRKSYRGSEQEREYARYQNDSKDYKSESQNTAKNTDMSKLQIKNLLEFINSSIRSNFNIDYKKGFSLMKDKMMGLNNRTKVTDKEAIGILARQLNNFIETVTRIKEKIDSVQEAVPIVLVIGVKIGTAIPSMNNKHYEKAKRDWGI